jgi:glycosyltransferase involved in cell wall biosynthesis
MKICVVVPVMNEKPTLEKLVQDVIEHIAPHRFRFIFVDDGSTDGSWEELLRLQRSYANIEAIRFPHNLGKTAALDVAFREADGDLVLTMDADLQDDPAEIPHLLAKMDAGYDMVCGWKSTRHDPWHKTLPSRIFNLAIARAFDCKLHDINTGFKVMHTRVAKGLNLFAEMHRMVAVQAHEQGYRVGEIPVMHHPRRFGKSKYGLERIFRGLRDAFTVWLMYRCPRGPARHFGRRAVVLFAAALLILVPLLLRGDETSPLSLIGLLAGATTVAGGLLQLAAALYGLRLLERVPARPLEHPVADRVGGE